MKKTIIYLISLSLCIIAISCDRHEKRETKHENGQIHEQYYVLETKDGSFIKDGTYKTWYFNGQPHSNGQYSQALKVGNWKYWYENGQMKSNYNLVRDTIDGAYINWYESGQKQSEGNVKMGTKVGPWSFWYENGQISSKRNFDQKGMSEGLQNEWYENGIKSTEYSYLNGKKEGEYKCWDRNGKLNILRHFRDNQDINLPAVYESTSGETLELNPDETYKLKYKEAYFWTTSWSTKSGSFEVNNEGLVLSNFNKYQIKKFNADTILLASYNKDIFFKRKLK